MTQEEIRQEIEKGKTVLGIELGSTRIKAVLIGTDHAPIASGSFSWENRLENGIWTYRLEDAWNGIRECYAKLTKEVDTLYKTPIRKLSAIGFSAMMHGFLPFDCEGNLLTPFRTWRNTMTEQAAAELTQLFRFNIPQRWSIAHLWQAILNQEEYVPRISFLTTLAGYIHWQLTGQKVLGVGEASGMFPIGEDGGYDSHMAAQFDALTAARGLSWKLRDILPKVLPAGENAGFLTEKGAKMLDPTGNLEAGIPFCPPEGDAGTGMTATNSVAPRTGNVSAGTSIFSMVVLEHPLQEVYPEIDLVTTPDGKPVAMVHCNNCTSDINAWAELLIQFSKRISITCTLPQALDAIFYAAAEGMPDCGGILNINYFSGEPVTGFSEGRPMIVRKQDAVFDFSNFSRSLLSSAITALKIGMDILTEKEKIKIDTLYGHGGFFKAKNAGQQLLASALRVPVSVMETAGEGGPWGMALLAGYSVWKSEQETLPHYLSKKVFSGNAGQTLFPIPEESEGFASYLEDYRCALEAEKSAVKYL